MLRIKNGFVVREVCGQSIIAGEGLGAVNFDKLLALNESAAWLWNEAQTKRNFTVEMLAKRLCEEYDVTEEQATHDVADILSEWQKFGVIEECRDEIHCLDLA